MDTSCVCIAQNACRSEANFASASLWMSWLRCSSTTVCISSCSGIFTPSQPAYNLASLGVGTCKHYCATVQPRVHHPRIMQFAKAIKFGVRVEWRFLGLKRPLPSMRMLAAAELSGANGKSGSDWHFLSYHGTYLRKNLVSHDSNYCYEVCHAQATPLRPPGRSA